MRRRTICGNPGHGTILSEVSVIVYDFYFIRPSLRPHEAYSPSLVDADTVLSRAIACEDLQAIARWNAQFTQGRYRVELIELSDRDLPQRLRARLPGSLRVATIEDVLRALVFETNDHNSMIARNLCYSNQKIRILLPYLKEILEFSSFEGFYVR